MTTIWAHRVGNYVQQPASGWDYTIRFSSFGELTERLSDKKLASSVSKLAIVAHGDDRGTIQLDRVLTSKNVYEFKNDLNTLSSYLERYAKLIFYSCIAGAGAEGTALLIGISKSLKSDTFVIGFTIKGAVAQEGLPSAPGQVLEAEHGFAGMPARLMKGLPVLTEASVFAKWAKGEQIIRLPYDEQVKQPAYKCGWPYCRGHKRPTDRCAPFKCAWGKCPGHLSPLDRCTQL